MKVFVLLCILLVPSIVASMTFDNDNWDSQTNSAPNNENGPACATDESCGCCLMLKQIDRLQKFFNHTLSHLEEELAKSHNILNNVRSNRVAFSVALNDEDTLSCYGPFRDNVAIFYKFIFINLGGNYDYKTGAFIVPRTGVYSLALTVYGDAGAPASTLAACANLQVNNNVVAGPKDINLQDQEDSASIVIVILLTAGDVVSVMMPAGCFLCDNKSHYNTFSGHLLYDSV